MYYIEVGFCTLRTNTQEVHPRNINFIKLQVSQDTNVELSSEEEKNSDIRRRKQDCSSCCENHLLYIYNSI